MNSPHRYAQPTAYDQMRREVQALWGAQRPVVEAACAELSDRLASDSYLRDRARGVRVEAARKALYRCGQRAGTGMLVGGGAGGSFAHARQVRGRPCRRAAGWGASLSPPPAHVLYALTPHTPAHLPTHTRLSHSPCPHTHNPLRCSSWKKLSDAGKPPKDVRDIAQLRVVIEPAPGGVAKLDCMSEKQVGIRHIWKLQGPGGGGCGGLRVEGCQAGLHMQEAGRGVSKRRAGKE